MILSDIFSYPGDSGFPAYASYPSYGFPLTTGYARPAKTGTVGSLASAQSAAIEPALVSSDPLSAIDWGTKLATTTVDVYFAPAGSYIDGVGDFGTAQGFTSFEKEQILSALGQFSKYTNLTFHETTVQSGAEFRIGSFELDSYGIMAFMIPPGEPYSGFMGLDPDYLKWLDGDSGNPLLSRGGFMYAVLLEELGHGLGLAHAHDDGGTSTILEGVTAPVGSYGIGDLNQGVFSLMNYNEGWPGGPYGDAYYDGTYSYVNDFGYEATPMALDIAVLQQKYGANLNWATGDTLYQLPESNGLGTFYECIWDAGGNDTIRYDGTADAIIDLRQATLIGDVGGGGYVSYAAGVRGGYTIAAGAMIEAATGGDGNDVLTGNAGDNVLNGRMGNDLIFGKQGADLIYGGNQFDTIDAGYGNDTVDGGNGRDSVALSAGDDLFLDNAQGGLLGRDTVWAGTGNDTIRGGDGDDEFRGQDGADLIQGGLGNDSLFGGGQFDTIDGGDGNDTVYGGNGRDHVLLGVGDDLFLDNAQGGAYGRDTVWGGAGNDTIQGGDGDDVFRGQDGADLIRGGLGNDSLFGGNQFDTIDGGAGNDTVDGGNGCDSVALGDGNDLFLDNLQGGSYGRDTVTGGAGDDTIQGGAGDDNFYGQLGRDVISGGGGNDTIAGGAGDDVLSGGAGADVFNFFSTGWGTDRVDDFETGVDKLRLDDALWSGDLTEAEVVQNYASIDNGNVVFSFDGMETIILVGLAGISGLEQDLIIV